LRSAAEGRADISAFAFLDEHHKYQYGGYDNVERGQENA
jgi:hypothetical protein